MGAPAIIEEALMIIGPLSIVSAVAKKSAIPSARETKAQEGYFIGWMLSNGQDNRGHDTGQGFGSGERLVGRAKTGTENTSVMASG